MRIAIFHNLPSGGGKRALFEVTRRLAAGHCLDVYTLSGAEHDFCDLRPYCNQHTVFPFLSLPRLLRPLGRVNQGLRAIDLLRLDASYKQIAEQIDSTGYDVVFVQQCQFTHAPGLLRFLKTPTAYYCAEPPRQLYEPIIGRPYNSLSPIQQRINRFDPFPTIYRSVLRRLDRHNFRAARQVLTNSAFSFESLYRIYGRQVRVAYLGVDTDMFRPTQLERQSYVLSVGAISALKGYDFLIRSLALTPQTQRPHLVIVGNTAPGGQEQQYLEKLAEKHAVQVTVRTLVNDEELVRLYSSALMTIYAPVMEPFGFSPLESMACSTPVIAVREGGVRESVIHGQTGLLVERNETAFAQALSGLLNAPHQLRSMRENCRPHVEANWRWEQSVTRIETHLKQISNDRTGATRQGIDNHSHAIETIGLTQGP